MGDLYVLGKYADMKVKTANDTLRKALDCTVNVFSVGILSLVFLFNLLCEVSVAYQPSEHVNYSLNWMLVLSPVFACALGVLLRLTKRCKVTTLFFVWSALYAVAIGYILLHTKNTLRADALAVFYGAREVAEGDYESLAPDGYFGMYPHQLGLMIYDIVLQKLCNRPKILFCANLVEVLAINWCGYRIAEACFHNEQINKNVIVLEFSFLPQFFFTMFGYGVVPGFCCLMIAVYQVILAGQKPKRQRRHQIIAAFFLTLSVLLKKNYIIGAAAIAITMLLTAFKQRRKSLALTALIFLVIPLLAPAVLEKGVSEITGIAMSDGVPSAAYIAMGTDLDNQGRAPGWYNGYNKESYLVTAQCDSALASSIAREKIKGNIHNYINNPLQTVKFYTKKVVSTWCDPLFQSIWSGPCPAMGAKVDGRVLDAIYTGGRPELLLQAFMKSMVIVLLGAALLFFKFHIESHPELKGAYLYLVGGFLFHLFWETKSQYVYTYVFLLIPMCAYEIWRLEEKLFSKGSRPNPV